MVRRATANLQVRACLSSGERRLVGVGDSTLSSVGQSSSRRPMNAHRAHLSTALVVALAGCASGGPPPLDTDDAPGEAAWRALATPRPTPIEGAPAIAIAGVDVAGLRTAEAMKPGAAPADVAVLELIAAGLLRRRDVEFVERRRFTAAEEAERRGVPRPAGAPPVGTSPGPDILVEVSWLEVGGTSTADIRLMDPTSGEILSSDRMVVPPGAGAIGFARRATRAILSGAHEIGNVPAWSDPISAAPNWLTPGIPSAAFAAFRVGTAAEDRYEWEDARRAYLRAREAGGAAFIEADVALARAARLRTGGTLGGS